MYKIGDIYKGAKKAEDGIFPRITNPQRIDFYFFYTKPTEKEIEEFRTGQLSFGVGRYSSALCFLLKVGDGNWADSPYHPHLDAEPQYPAFPAEGVCGKIGVTLVDNITQIVMATRLFELPSAQYEKLWEMIEMQRDVSIAAHCEAITATYNKYSTDDMTKKASFLLTSLAEIPCVPDVAPVYPDLPSQLLPHYVYLSDCGHSIFCFPDGLRDEATTNPADYKFPVPVKYVLSHAYTVEDGNVYIDVEYDEDFGGTIDDEYYEY